MNFDLLKLHSNEEDKTNRQLLRVYSVVPRHAKQVTEKEILAEKIVKILREINEKLKKVNPRWKKEWVDKIPVKVSETTSKDWMTGRASIPLVAIEKLKEFDCEKEVSEIMNYAKYFSTSTVHPFVLPKETSKDLAYLVVAILCDGNVKKIKSRVDIQVTNKELLIRIQQICKNVFDINCHYKTSNMKQHPRSKKQLYRLYIDCKLALRLLTKFFEVPRGKKAHKIVVPKIIMNSSTEIKKSFLRGVFDTDGGKRGRGLGLTTASLTFRDQIVGLLEEFEIKVNKDEWVNKLYNKKYYGLYFSTNINDVSFLFAGVG